MTASPAARYALAFAIPGFLVAAGIVAATWLVAPELLPLGGRSWGDATYPVTGTAAAALLARFCFATARGRIAGRGATAAIGALIAFASFYLACVHAGAALLLHHGDARWWLDAFAAGFWSYLFWAFAAFWGWAVLLLGAAIGWRTHALLAGEGAIE